ncbi:MAG: type II toxin-antitoxin system Phd/YefM family antitoxin [Gammaproteobacteria bacterium]|jgi:antitoxin Phd|nr:type II toxin-antitoxin system Phd/YefM family antitoxin [Gammaproteobacteria bacterium]
MNWQLQEAKNRLSELVKAAESEGPQVITVHGREKAVVLSTSEYRKLTARRGTIVEFFQKSPLRGIELDLTRSKDVGREVEL